MGQQMSYLQDQAMAATSYKKSGKDQEAALDKALKSADYLASRGADGIAALKDLCKQKKAVTKLFKLQGWRQRRLQTSGMRRARLRRAVTSVA